jgi:hypothetical protein
MAIDPGSAKPPQLGYGKLLGKKLSALVLQQSKHNGKNLIGFKPKRNIEAGFMNN